MSDFYNRLMNARTHFHDREVHYMREVMNIIISFPIAPEDLVRANALHTACLEDRNDRGVDFANFDRLVQFAVKLSDENRIDTPAGSHEDTAPPSPDA